MQEAQVQLLTVTGSVTPTTDVARRPTQAEANIERNVLEMAEWFAAGNTFEAKRTFRGAVALQGRPRTFVVGIELAIRMSGTTGVDVAADRGYEEGWLTDIKRRLAKGEGTTRETVVWLRESLPLLERWMNEGLVEWPLVQRPDYHETRAGVQTEKRKQYQRRRRGL